MVIISHTKNLKSMILNIIHSAMKGVINTAKENPMLFHNISVGIVPVSFPNKVNANTKEATRLNIQADMLVIKIPIHVMRIRASSTGSRMILTGNNKTNLTTLRIELSSISLVVF